MHVLLRQSPRGTATQQVEPNGAPDTRVCCEWLCGSNSYGKLVRYMKEKKRLKVKLSQKRSKIYLEPCRAVRIQKPQLNKSNEFGFEQVGSFRLGFAN